VKEIIYVSRHLVSLKISFLGLICVRLCGLRTCNAWIMCARISLEPLSYQEHLLV
jgi:hypothetical protein